jgi:H+/Cl- antiporter ClcA
MLIDYSPFPFRTTNHLFVRIRFLSSYTHPTPILKAKIHTYKKRIRMRIASLFLTFLFCLDTSVAFLPIFLETRTFASYRRLPGRGRILLHADDTSSKETNGGIQSSALDEETAREEAIITSSSSSSSSSLPTTTTPNNELKQVAVDSVTSPPPSKIVFDVETTTSYSSINFDAVYVLFSSAIIGIMTGFTVCLFKLSIESLRDLLYASSLTETVPIFIVPAIGGLGVSALAASGKFSSGLRGTANEVDALSINTMSDERFKDASSFLRKPLAAIVTLGSGNSLGPEGPSVEVGMSISRICMPPTPLRRGDETYEETAARIRRNRLLLSAGAAAGVAAGFNAPLAGVFFALEIVQQYQPPLNPAPAPTPSTTEALIATPRAESSEAEKWFQSEPPDFLSGSGSITAILLSSVMSALISQAYLGDSLALSVPHYDLKQPLTELPLYLLLGVISGFVAGSFSALAQFFKGLFDGEAGPMVVQKTMRIVPNWSKPALGGLIVGSIGMVYPQVLFFGYETLNTLLAKPSVPTDLVLTLLVLKTFTTALSAGSGLVGGTFAPSLFLGAMVGAAFHNVIGQMFLTAHASSFELADVQAYAMVGAAGVLAALFRAPLTASLLLFELTRDYEVILPVVASAGVGSVIGDLVEKNWEEKKRDRDAVSWGDLSDRDDEEDIIHN